MRSLLVLTAAAVFSCGASAQAGSTDDHAAHHPGDASTPAAKGKTPAAARSKPAAASAAQAASGGMGMGGADMQKMHDDAHKPGGKHERMHGRAGSEPMKGMAAASAASK